MLTMNIFTIRVQRRNRRATKINFVYENATMEENYTSLLILMISYVGLERIMKVMFMLCALLLNHKCLNWMKI